MPSGPMSIARAGDVQHTTMAGVGESSQEVRLVGEDAQLVAVDHVEREQLLVEERRRPGAGDHVAGIDVLDVAHRSSELSVDLGLAQAALVVVGHLVDHRVPDRARELQPVQVDGAVSTQLCEVVRPAVVLVDEDRGPVGHHQCRIAARPVGDRCLDVDGHGQAWGNLEFLGVDRADELGETECLESALLFAGGEAGQQDRDVAAKVLTQPRLVVMVAVEVRDVEEVGPLDALAEVIAQLVVAGKHEPRAEERRNEPGVADDRSSVGLDEHAGMADGRRAHVLRLRRRAESDPAHDVARGQTPREISGAQATGGSVNCWPARDTCSVHAAPSQ